MQGHEIEVVPGFDNFSILDPDDCDAGKVDRRVSRSSSEEVAFVLCAHGAASSDFVTFGDHVLDDDRNLWESVAEQCVERSEVSWSYITKFANGSSSSKSALTRSLCWEEY